MDHSVFDPSIDKHILRDNSKAYSKGMLAEILELVMVKGLIPTDGEMWRIRRHAIVPALHLKPPCPTQLHPLAYPPCCHLKTSKLINRRRLENHQNPALGREANSALTASNSDSTTSHHRPLFKGRAAKELLKPRPSSPVTSAFRGCGIVRRKWKRRE
ncbi:Cytochrome P [Parasponia andersonii]|uniref:Cytochrome P n=1 Tax=Parasponia andersonii TaxID=3476 RepID=A0A2P5AP16_PARAD|nr:Cytochrome P [Parasponia andersonii]